MDPAVSGNSLDGLNHIDIMNMILVSQDLRLQNGVEL